MHAATAAPDPAEADGGRSPAGADTGSIIGQAQDVLIAQLRITADEAFHLLVHDFQDKRIAVREVAAMHVDEAGGAVGQ